MEDEDEGDDTIWKTPTTSTHVYKHVHITIPDSLAERPAGADPKRLSSREQTF